MSDFIEDPNNPGFWIGIVHPTIMSDIRRQAARADWYHRRHVERWERRYKKPYPKPIMTRGTFLGMSIYYGLGRGYPSS